jgi:hypothetical protein
MAEISSSELGVKPVEADRLERLRNAAVATSGKRWQLRRRERAADCE